jgi:hypothetical protein
MSEESGKCELRGEPLPAGESMFRLHGYSGPCPKPPLPRKRPAWIDIAAEACADMTAGKHKEKFAEIIEMHAPG